MRVVKTIKLSAESADKLAQLVKAEHRSESEVIERIINMSLLRAFD